jgi:hypothetical protein
MNAVSVVVSHARDSAETWWSAPIVLDVISAERRWHAACSAAPSLRRPTGGDDHDTHVAAHRGRLPDLAM